MKKLLFIPILFIIATGAAFAQGNAAIGHSTITFQIKNLGINTHGSIGGLKAEAKFNPADLPGSAIEASVDVNTINTDNEKRDHHLKSDDFFDVAKYPLIKLKSISFKHKSGSNYVGVFSLTIKDKTKQVEIPFSYNADSFKGEFKINRRDYGIGGSSMIMADEVTITIEAGK
jgi:polyisoprenoid-binding protein YceI